MKYYSGLLSESQFAFLCSSDFDGAAAFSQGAFLLGRRVTKVV